jgi:hypothetical protein
MTRLIHQPDPLLDLVFERIVDVPQELVWAAWTTPEHLTHWFTPVPWKTVDCKIDLRPGGIFRTVMRSPEGKDSMSVVTSKSLRMKSLSGPMHSDLVTGHPTLPLPRRPHVVLSFSQPSFSWNAIKKVLSIPRSLSTRTRRVENSMKKWGSTKAGAKPSISSLRM